MSYRDSFTFNPEKFKALLLYISNKLESEANSGFKTGAVRLNKVLFYSDFISFMNYGKPITGAKYIRKPRGPVASEMNGMKSQLISEGVAIEKREPIISSAHAQNRFVAIKQTNPEKMFTEGELEIIDEVIEDTKYSPAFDLSLDAHELQPWKVIPNDGDEIPYSTITIPPVPLPLYPEEMEYGKKLAAKIAI
jgi:hypothetical protein